MTLGCDSPDKRDPRIGHKRPTIVQKRPHNNHQCACGDTWGRATTTAPTSFFYIVSGACRVTVGGEEVNRLEAGQFLGEIGVIYERCAPVCLCACRVPTVCLPWAYYDTRSAHGHAECVTHMPVSLCAMAVPDALRPRSGPLSSDERVPSGVCACANKGQLTQTHTHTHMHTGADLPALGLRMCVRSGILRCWS